MPCVPIFDPPWVPQNTGSVQDPINEDQSVSAVAAGKYLPLKRKGGEEKKNNCLSLLKLDNGFSSELAF